MTAKLRDLLFGERLSSNDSAQFVHARPVFRVSLQLHHPTDSLFRSAPLGADSGIGNRFFDCHRENL